MRHPPLGTPQRNAKTGPRPVKEPEDVHQRLVDTVNAAWDGGIQLRELLAATQREFIRQGFAHTRGHRGLLADAIGVHRNTLTRIMERVGAPAPERRKQCAQRRLFS